jgi:hypothetical protein
MTRSKAALKSAVNSKVWEPAAVVTGKQTAEELLAALAVEIPKEYGFEPPNVAHTGDYFVVTFRFQARTERGHVMAVFEDALSQDTPSSRKTVKALPPGGVARGQTIETDWGQEALPLDSDDRTPPGMFVFRLRVKKATKL